MRQIQQTVADRPAATPIHAVRSGFVIPDGPGPLAFMDFFAAMLSKYRRAAAPADSSPPAVADRQAS